MPQSGWYLQTAVAGERFGAFVPFPLPPEPPIELSRLQPLLDRANQAVGRLDGAGLILSSPNLFVFMAMRKEALLSSQIEGTQSSLSDLLLFEAKEAFGSPLDDVMEVSNYIAAMRHGLERLRGGFPLSLRLLREIHGVLLQRGRGHDKQPGEFRRSQNWIGGTQPGNAAFVPPPPNEMEGCLAALELFLHAEPGLPFLMQTALAHAQFETIHPFLDGNGRLGRLLITVMLCEAKILHAPILYLSLYFKQHRTRYYELLQGVRDHGSWEDWIAFFLEGVAVTSETASDTIRRMLSLFAETRERVASAGRSATTLRVLDLLQQSPIITITYAKAELDLSYPSVAKAVDRLQGMGIVSEQSGRSWGRSFAFDAYLALLSEGTEPIPP